MLFFDLHCHPGTKTLFKYDPNQISPWESIEVPDGILGNAFDSQSSYEILSRNNNINLVCLALHPPEKKMIDNVLIYGASQIPPYSNYLQFQRLCDMANDIFDYKKLLDDEFENIQLSGKKSIKILESFKDYDINDRSTLYIIFSVEGGHTYYDDKNNDECLRKMLENFQAVLDRPGLIFFAGITHLTPNVFANHAFGNKFGKRGNFIPVGCGITEKGKALINKIYERNVLVDIKHMSWVARQEFYKLRRQQWNNKPIIASHIALTGFSYKKRWDHITSVKKGNSFYKVRYNKQTGVIKGTYFNPNSINFYDEDIVEILASKGLAGIILDIRVLGGGKDILQPIEKEHELVSIQEFIKDWTVNDLGIIEESFTLNKFSEEEPYNDRFEKEGSYSQKEKSFTKQTEVIVDKGDLITDIWDKEDQDAEREEMIDLFPSRADQIRYSEKMKPQPEKHLKYFINQLLKFKLIADEYAEKLPGINVWDHICIGSDFDGMISAIHCCNNASEFESFSNLVRTALPECAKECRINLGEDSPAVIVNKIFWENAYKFLQNHF